MMEEKLSSNPGPDDKEGPTILLSDGSSEGQGNKSLNSDILPSDEVKGDGLDSEYLSGFKLVAVLSAVTLTAFLMLLDTSVVVTAIPKITTHFGSTADIGWYGSAYLLCNCSIQPLGGKIYKHFPSKLTFLSFLALFVGAFLLPLPDNFLHKPYPERTLENYIHLLESSLTHPQELGSLICGVANSSHMLIIGRATAGMGGAGIVTGVLTILATSVPLSRRPLMMGLLMGIANLGTAVGPLIGGALTEYLTWRWCFFINLPCGAIVAGILLVIHVPEGSKPVSDGFSIWSILGLLDLGGFITFAPAIVMFLLALSWGGTAGYPFNSATIIGLFVGSAVMFAIFLGWESHRGDTAMVPLAIFKNRIVTAGCLVQLFLMGNMMITIYYLPVWFQAILERSPISSGVYLTPLVGSQIVNSIGGGILITVIGVYLPFGVIGLGLGAIGTGLLATFNPTTATSAWIGYQILTGFRGIALQIPVLAVQNNIPKESIAIGNSMLVFTQNFGGTIFLSLAELIFSNTLSTSIATYAPEADAKSILLWGATGFRDHYSKEALPGVLEAYNKAIVASLYLSAGASAVACVCSMTLGWKNIKKPAAHSQA